MQLVALKLNPKKHLILSYPSRTLLIYSIFSAEFVQLLTFQFPFLRLFLTGPLVLDLVTYFWIKIKEKGFEIDMLFLALTFPLIFCSADSDSHEWKQTKEEKNSVPVIWSRWCRPQHIHRQSGKPDWISWHGSSLAGMQLRWFAGQFLAKYILSHIRAEQMANAANRPAERLSWIFKIIKWVLPVCNCDPSGSTTRIVSRQ